MKKRDVRRLNKLNDTSLNVAKRWKLHEAVRAIVTNSSLLQRDMPFGKMMSWYPVFLD
jgi:hypothetical protein